MTLKKIGARLSELLDEDQWTEIETLLLAYEARCASCMNAHRELKAQLAEAAHEIERCDKIVVTVANAAEHKLAEREAEYLKLEKLLDIIEDAEAAILAKLSEQKPVAWESPSMGLTYENHYSDNMPLYKHPSPDELADFLNRFSRHVGGDGEFWLHELWSFYKREKCNT